MLLITQLFHPLSFLVHTLCFVVSFLFILSTCTVISSTTTSVLGRCSSELPLSLLFFVPIKKEFSCVYHPHFSAVLAGTQFSFELLVTLSTALSPCPTP